MLSPTWPLAHDATMFLRWIETKNHMLCFLFKPASNPSSWTLTWLWHPLSSRACWQFFVSCFGPAVWRGLLSSLSGCWMYRSWLGPFWSSWLFISWDIFGTADPSGLIEYAWTSKMQVWSSRRSKQFRALWRNQRRCSCCGTTPTSRGYGAASQKANQHFWWHLWDRTCMLDMIIYRLWWFFPDHAHPRFHGFLWPLWIVFLKPSTTGQRQLRIGNPCEDRSIAQGNKNSTFVDAVLDA